MLIFILNSIHISLFLVIIDKPCPGDALLAELRDLQKGKYKPIMLVMYEGIMIRRKFSEK